MDDTCIELQQKLRYNSCENDEVGQGSPCVKRCIPVEPQIANRCFLKEEFVHWTTDQV